MNIDITRRRPVTRQIVHALLAGALLAGPALGAAAAVVEPGDTAAQWRAQKLEFSFTGFTTSYTCDGIESKVRDILLSFGARNDVKVRATGCQDAMNRPSKFAWVAVEFSSLAPAPDAAADATVQARWTKVQLAPNRPSYMGMGECELVEQMLEVLQKGFALRNAAYRTSCMPHQITVADYSVTSEALKTVLK